MAELNRQRPDTAMHMAPCTKASSSSSRGASARMRAMSATLISRAHTTRLAPSSCHMRAASAFMTPACVLTCSSTCGACRRASEKAPRSLTMSASASAASSASRYAGSAATSSAPMSAFTAT